MGTPSLTMTTAAADNYSLHQSLACQRAFATVFILSNSDPGSGE